VSSPKTAVPRRPYERVTVAASASGFAVWLDEKPLKSPGGNPMMLPSAAMAEAIAAEWRTQGARPNLLQLPMTRIAATALDRIPAVRDAVVAELAAYAETELVCHRAGDPPELVARQAALWQPLLDWLAQHYDAPLVATAGVLPRAQPPASLQAIRRALAAFDDFHLAGVSVAVAATGSLVIGLALSAGRTDAAQAFDAAELDATFQIERWGEDEIARQRRVELRAELETAAMFSRLLRD
jgi:chaperone required for assembly of F1-ATPase